MATASHTTGPARRLALPGVLSRALRLAGAGLVGGLVAGAVAGLGARLAMLVMRLLAPNWIGITTHGGEPVGTVTLSGTLDLALEGALFYGIPGGLFYLLVRPWLPRRLLHRALAHAVVMLAVGAPAVLDGSYEYFRYGHVGVAVALFASLLPLYGVLVAVVTERLAGPAPRVRSPWWLRRAGSLAVAAATGYGLVRLAIRLRDLYHLW